MKIAYNPKGAAALTKVPEGHEDDILFDLQGLNIFAKGIKFKGTDTTYLIFKKHTSAEGGGYNGLVPVPSYTTTNIRFLREDGTWQAPSLLAYSLTIQTNGTTLGSFNGSADKTFNITYDNVGAAPAIHTHTSNQIIALTDYTKAASDSLDFSIEATDSLNVALGKLEYKADLGVTAYNIVSAANDGDGTIENLNEILKVLQGIKDTDTITGILANYVTLNTTLTIVGEKTFSLLLKSTVTTGTAPLSVTSTTLNTNLNADLLDGLHYTSFARADQNPNVDLDTVNGIGIMCNPWDHNATSENHYPMQQAGVLFYGTGAYGSACQIYGTYANNTLYYRGGGDGPSEKKPWREVAFIDSNVLSATKLLNKRYLWGQEFDGTADVSGNMTNVGNIIASGIITTSVNGKAFLFGSDGAYIGSNVGSDFYMWGGGDIKLRLGTNNQERITILGNGDVGIGITSPTLKLHVAGNVLATYYNSAINDEALSDIGSVYVRNTSDNFIRRVSKALFYSILDRRYRPMSGNWKGSAPGTREFGFTSNNGSGEVSFSYDSGVLNMSIDGNIYITDQGYLALHTGNYTTHLDSRYFIHALNFSLLEAYVAARFNDNELAKKATSTYIEFWQGNSGWFNFAIGNLNVNGSARADSFIKKNGTSSQFLKADGSVTELSALDARYVNVIGDTMTGILIIDTTGNAQGIIFKNSSVSKGWVGYEVGKGACLYNYENGFYLGIKDDGTPHFQNNTLLHTGNYVDILDSRYVNVSGDTMTGYLNITTNSRNLKLGCQNVSYAHYETNADAGHWFNRNVRVAGQIYAGPGYDKLVWNAGNDGSGSGLDADLLDGLHGYLYGNVVHYGTKAMYSSGYYKINIRAGDSWMYYFCIRLYQGYTFYDIDISGYNYAENHWHSPQAHLKASNADSITVYFGYDSTWNLWVAVPAGNYTGIGVYNLVNGHTQHPLNNAFTIAYQSSLTGTIQTSINCKRGAYINDNVASATKLLNTRTLWGQPFNGELNVSGNMTGVGNFTGVGQFKYGSNNENDATYGKYHRLNLGYHAIDHTDFYESAINFYGNGGTVLYTHLSNSISYFTSKVGIGTSAPSYKLDVNGSFHATSIHITNGGGTWISQKTTTSCIYADNYVSDGSNYKALLRMKNTNGNVMTLGSISNQFGFWGYKNATTDNRTDCSFIYDFGNNNWYTSESMISSGNIYATHFYENSDIRYKTVINNLSIKANQIANIPLFDFKWKDNEDLLNTGTSAQAVQLILPYLVSGEEKLTLNYGVLGTIAGVIACKELTEQEKEIEKLKDRVKELENKLTLFNSRF